MSHSERVNRARPSCFFFLIDQSKSMDDAWGGDTGKRKADGLATIMNRVLRELVLACTSGTKIYRYFDVGILGYGGTVNSAFVGGLAGRELVGIDELGDAPDRIEERKVSAVNEVGEEVDEKSPFPIWIDPIANGGTPMCEVFTKAAQILTPWVAQHRDSFPPVVINVTDGESTDGNPAGAAQQLRNLDTSDGNVLLFNIHLSSDSTLPIRFPTSAAGLPNEFASALFEMSSVVPSSMAARAPTYGETIAEGARGFVFNGDMVTVLRLLKLGTALPVDR